MNMTPSKPKLDIVKVCGLVSSEDAEMVVRVANKILPRNTDLFLGMILWPGSRRSVSLPTAKRISQVARGSGATPVAVFVDEDVDQMKDICQKCDIPVAQLHGPQSRKAWSIHHLDTDLKWIDVQQVDTNGKVQSTLLDTENIPSWTLFDSKGGGTGTAFDWKNFSPPTYPWLLAGGLNPENVADAIHTLGPSGLDVASGVAGSDRCIKDEERVRSFLENAVSAYSM